MKSQEAENKLFTIAEAQQGYFTAKQAKSCGYRDNTHPYHVSSGNWIRVYRGIYRLSKFPQSERPDLIIWALWSCNKLGEMKGVYSHQTALSIHELCDVMPDKLHMTVPLSFRRSTSLPPILILYRKTLQKDEVFSMDGYLVTTPYRTLLDVIEEAAISHDLILQAVKIAARKGVITQKKLKQLLNDPVVQNSPLRSYLQRL